MKITNAKAGVTADIDEGGDAKPTLKKRQPDADPSDKPAAGDSSSSDGPPKLKKRNEPEPTPTPKPDQQ